MKYARKRDNKPKIKTIKRVKWRTKISNTLSITKSMDLITTEINRTRDMNLIRSKKSMTIIIIKPQVEVKRITKMK